MVATRSGVDTLGMETMVQEATTLVSGYLTPVWLTTVAALFLAIWSGAAGRTVLAVQRLADLRAARRRARRLPAQG
ncbi:MAG TPA: hypothetical protein VLL51_05005 [Gemmatimonadales bacterium]|nr:hypothetical protein [Gemmatimonadales bacterium]